MYSNTSYKKPFWAENSGFMTGRDPLGVQNSSIKTYGKLLPGLTNLTLRLRYYGFYMWVLDEFFKKQDGNKDFSQRDQHNFIRRGELIIAYLMRHIGEDEQSIIGSNFTNSHAEDLELNGFYNIALGADKLADTVKDSVYWDYISGALGQYYAGSLSILKLISVDNKFFSLESRGKELASAFRASIPRQEEELFLKCIENGKLTLDDIEKLTSFSISNIEVDSEEWQFYESLLLGEDGTVDAEKKISYNRKTTMELLLMYHSNSDDNYNDRSFILHEYIQNTNQLKDGASFGWYYYYVNEVFHFALETIFWGMLVEMDGKPMPVNEFLNEIKGQVVNAEASNGVYKTNSSLEDIVIQIEDVNVHEALAELEQLTKSTVNNVHAMKNAIELMLLNYISIDQNIKELEEFEKRYFIAGQKGCVSENYHVYVHQNLQVSFEKFVSSAIQQLLNDHINTAYRKMGNGESNLLKFIIEDGIISHIQTMPPKHTSPRLKTITNFLRDLSLIGDDNMITDAGKKALIRISE